MLQKGKADVEQKLQVTMSAAFLIAALQISHDRTSIQMTFIYSIPVSVMIIRILRPPMPPDCIAGTAWNMLQTRGMPALKGQYFLGRLSANGCGR